MPIPIVLDLGGVRLEGELADTPAGSALAGRLPVELRVQRWGEEYYGDLGTPLGKFGGETRQVMAVGELAYWAPGNALCLFFGPTPVSQGSEPRAASPVHPVGKAGGDWSAVKALPGSVRARMDRRTAGS